MPTVTDTIELPGTVLDAGARVDVYLVASLTDSTVEGFVTASKQTILDKSSAVANASGVVSFALRANTLITPANTYYVWVTHFADGRINRRSIIVPNGAGPYNVPDITLSPAPAVAPFVTPLVGQGIESAKPSNATMVAAGNRTGWRWYSTDIFVWWYFDGTVWRVDTGRVYASVTRTSGGGAAQSITTGTFTAIDLFDTEDDPLGFHAASAASLIVPTGYAARYSIGFVAAFASNGTGTRIAEIRVNGTAIERTEMLANSAASAETRVPVSARATLAVGDAVTGYVEHSKGSALLLGNGFGNYARLSLDRVG